MSATSKQGLDLGTMPVWDLRDLYPSPQSAEVQADLKKAAAEARRIKAAYEGKLAALARRGTPFGEAIAAYEALVAEDPAWGHPYAELSWLSLPARVGPLGPGAARGGGGRAALGQM